LTAILSLSNKAEFLNIIKIEILDDYKFCRSISYLNIVYSIVKYNSIIEQTETVCHLIEKKLKQYSEPVKIIIYSNNIDIIKELNNVLNCYIYYTDIESTKEKDEIQQQ
jgi:hypothetical protein